MITALKLTFTPIAKGAASWTHIGVGIELPLSADNIDEAKSEGATLEEGNDRATFLLSGMMLILLSVRLKDM